MASWVCSRDALALTAMAAVQLTFVGMNTLYKAASSKGMGYFVYITYSYALGTLLLFCICFIFSRKELGSFKLSVLYRIILLSLIWYEKNFLIIYIGARSKKQRTLFCFVVLFFFFFKRIGHILETSFFARICGFKGVEYSSPTLSSVIGTISPAFTFAFAVLFRMENVDWRSTSTKAKIIGTIVSGSGALIAVLYNGPKIIFLQSATAPSLSFPQTSPTNWALGGILLTTENLLTPISLILMKHTVKMHTNLLTMSFLYNLFVMIITIPVSILVERDTSAWRLRQDITLIAVIYSGFFGPALISTVHLLCAFWKGPVYVAIFAPISIIVAAAASVIFLDEALHLGSVIGSVTLLLGFYAVLWGKAKEEKSIDCSGSDIFGACSNKKTPLLQSYR